MNKIKFFTDSKTVTKHFSSIEKSSKWDFETVAVCDLRKELKAPNPKTIYILDHDSVPEDDKTKNLNYFVKKDSTPRIVLDRRNAIHDPADLLMKGCDYINGHLMKTGIKPARLNRYTDFFHSISDTGEDPEASDSVQKQGDPKRIISENGWKDIKSGKEYTFIMLFAEMSIPSEWKKKSGNVHLNQLKNTFQSVAERISAQCGGKLWIWNEYGGLILFPYTGQACVPVIPGIKMMMNRVLISIEDFQLHTPVNFRVSMHIGETKWKARGNTGTIISDSINSIFHLGTKYTPLNNMDITADLYDELPAGIKSLFSKAGTFEGREIYRLCSINVFS